MVEPASTPQAPVKPGDVLASKYRVEKVLGVGGMGVVVAAMHMELEERVALKFLLPAAAQNPAVVARFSREARAAVKIKSQHVARVSDVGTLENGTPYIVMEYLQGRDLGAVLTHDGRLDPGVAIDYVLQASEAVAEAHAAGIVHRDLKPANLFLAEQPDGTAIVKVLDFGISKAVIAEEPGTKSGALTGTTDVFGSPTYMSPEQLKASRDVDARTDIWSLGVILYELIGGKAPFERATVAETFGSILYEQPAPLRSIRSDVPEELDRAILRCLEKDVAKRTPNLAELATALLPFAATASHASVDRASRVLRRAGLVRDGAPGEVSSSGAIAVTNLGSDAGRAAAPGSQTRSAWGAPSGAPRPGGSRATVLAGVVAGVVVTGLGSVLLLRRLSPPEPTVPVQADRAPSSTATAAGGGAPSPAAAPTPAPSVVVAVAPTASPVVTAAASATASAAAPHGKHGGHKHGPEAAPPPATAPAPAKPAPKPLDDDFGDRK